MEFPSLDQKTHPLFRRTMSTMNHLWMGRLLGFNWVLLAYVGQVLMSRHEIMVDRGEREGMMRPT